MDMMRYSYRARRDRRRMKRPERGKPNFDLVALTDNKRVILRARPGIPMKGAAADKNETVPLQSGIT